MPTPLPSLRQGLARQKVWEKVWEVEAVTRRAGPPWPGSCPSSAPSRDGGRASEYRPVSWEGRGAEGAHLGQLAQQAEGDGSRPTAHLQDEGAALGSHRTGLLGHLLQHPLDQLLQGSAVWIRGRASLAPWVLAQRPTSCWEPPPQEQRSPAPGWRVRGSRAWPAARLSCSKPRCTGQLCLRGRWPGSRQRHCPQVPPACAKPCGDSGAGSKLGPRRWDWHRAAGAVAGACGLGGEAVRRVAGGRPRLSGGRLSWFPGRRQTCSGWRMTPQPTTLATTSQTRQPQRHESHCEWPPRAG